MRGAHIVGLAVALGLSAAAFAAAPADVIDLADIVGGGDGTGTAPPGNVGINADTGVFATAMTSGHIANTGFATQPVDDSDFIDSVFIITMASLEITQSGVIFDFAAADAIGTIWDHIRKDNNPDRNRNYLLVGGQQFASGVGIHASAGITFDLDAMRAEHGPEKVGCFTTFAGMDDCGSGDVNLYVILSDELEVIDFLSSHAIANGGELLQLEIPEEAKFLTLATGSNGADSCDHGTFANAWIWPRCPGDEPVGIEVVPEKAHLAPDWTQSLRATLVTEMGNRSDVTADPETTYETSDPAVAEVSPDGIVAAVGPGTATISVRYLDFVAEVSVVVIGKIIDLGNIAAGGDGTMPRDQLPYVGINPDTGLFAASRLNADVPDTGENPQEVIDSDFIDSVFILTMASLEISTTGVVFDFAIGDTGNGWDVILNGWENDGPDYLEVASLGRFERGLGIHANAGITFDLDVIRAEHGADAVKYVSAYAGDASGGHCVGNGTITAYLIVSDDVEPIDAAVLGPFTDDGEFVQLEIPAGARFVSFAIGGAGDGIGCDHGVFANAFITPCDITRPETCGGGPPPILFRRGEIGVDLDGVLTIGDAIFLLNYMFAGGPTPSCLDAGDVDDSGDFTIGDAIWLLNYQFGGGPAPKPPFEACGPDPTPGDPLDCASFPPCR